MVPPGESRQNGKTYAQWAAAWLKWAWKCRRRTQPARSIHCSTPLISTSPNLRLPTCGSWPRPFLKGVRSTVERSCQIPSGKSLFFPLFVVEGSDIEAPPFYGRKAEDQAANAQITLSTT